VQNIMVVLSRRWDTAEDPLEQIGVRAVEQVLEALELRLVQTCETGIGERSEDEIAFLRSAMPTSEQEPLAADVGQVVVPDWLTRIAQGLLDWHLRVHVGPRRTLNLADDLSRQDSPMCHTEGRERKKERIRCNSWLLASTFSVARTATLRCRRSRPRRADLSNAAAISALAVSSGSIASRESW